MSTVIKAEDLGKKYIIGHRKLRYRGSLRDAVTHTARATWQRIRHPLSPNRESLDLEELWALKDVNFEVQQGDRIGIIGRNGAGKSTLLKILSRITEPTTGRVHIKGRVSSLLEVGTGFHPELSGRENIFLNGAILGMTRQEIKRKFDEIVAFADLEKFLDTPVKRYSSGMYVRLAFAVAAHLEPEILIVDEVLAVGDVAFQKKCLGKMDEVAKAGRTVLFVSHNMAAVSALCKSGVLIEEGRLVEKGEADDVVRTYLRVLENKASEPIQHRKDRGGNQSVQILDIWVDRSNSDRVSTLKCGDQISIKLSYDANQAEGPLSFVINVYNELNQRVLGFHSDKNPVAWPQAGVAQCDLCEPLHLRPGRYGVNAAVFSNGALADHVPNALIFEVVDGDFCGAGRLPNKNQPMFLVPNKWGLVRR